ncbi:MAG: hypothetical protein EOP86_03665 [Verrucomicrobiaceae bacterium]|nr:MAG: hypothetical protein EOP86_03665 [Verrucomicrobiaceae bacterium]
MDRKFQFQATRRRFLTAGAGAFLPFLKSSAPAAEEALSACLPPGRWAQVEERVDGILAGISIAQQPGGALGAGNEAQPAATSLAITAFLSRGHAPGRGPYGACLRNALEYVLSVQDAEGVFSGNGRSQDATYHHAISGLMLGEVYGMAGQGQSQRVRTAIARALAVSRRSQLTSPGGTGMRYFTSPRDADLSVTGAHFLFYRSARNAEFDVPESWIHKMLTYVQSCAAEGGGFNYQPHSGPSLAMSSVGLLFMVMTGRQSHPLAVATARHILTYDYSEGVPRRDYTLYYASLAMSQMGGEHWRAFYPRLVDAQLSLPRQDSGLVGAAEPAYGAVLANAFYVLSLTPPCQVLPIFQR